MNITVDRKVLEMALEALENLPALSWIPEQERTVFEAITGLRTALGHQYMTNAAGELEPVTVVQTGVGIWKLEPEPVAWMLKTGHGTGFTDKLTDELKALTWKGKPMWTPLYDAPPPRKPEPEQEPVAKVCHDLPGHIGWNPRLNHLPDEETPLYTSPPQRKPFTTGDLQEALANVGLINRAALDDAENYDDGETLAQIDLLWKELNDE